MTTTPPLLHAVVAASRLSEVIAEFTVRRLLIRAGILPADLTPDTLARALPELRAGLGLYLRPDELEAAVSDLERLTH